MEGTGGKDKPRGQGTKRGKEFGRKTCPAQQHIDWSHVHVLCSTEFSAAASVTLTTNKNFEEEREKGR